jgi:hypothetical protein
VGGGNRGARYNLNPNGAWKETAESPAQGSDLVGSDGLNPDQVRTNGPSADCKNVDSTASAKNPNQINKGESSIPAKNCDLLAMTSQAIQHADRKKP